ncbi:DUF2793 domain-containing protein [Qipengyuania atrilutea]|uniref:DUF2793 domain-containing protein n=1 Tax=Qipengyuania atrilutea TaxID=2744473 RepID=A0A850H384_9SPHN|nr:DUF2793 domain-containing protein [Actirhodobacter atriluteus]
MLAGQSQKELFVNEAFALLDALVHPVVESEAASPPARPRDGECWIVSSQAAGEWAAKSGQVAYFETGQWAFAQPVEGLAVYDRAARQFAFFDGAWLRAPQVSEPAGGSTVDVEARDAIGKIVTALRTSGILPQV